MKLKLEVWQEEDFRNLRKYLITLKDEKYSLFNKKLIFTNDEIVGIRTPILRKIAKEISKGNMESFLDNFEYRTYEDKILYSLVLGNVYDKNLFDKYFKNYVEFVDNWATCDMGVSSFKIIKKYKEFYFNIAKELISSNKEFEIRIGIIILLDYYLEDEYIDEVISLTKKIKSDLYYVNMALAWLISVILVKYYDKIIIELENKEYSYFVQNKAIQKARESYRISEDKKEYLKTLKFKR